MYWILIIYYLYDLAYPSSYSFTGSISPISCVLILNQYKSLFSTYTILFIRSVIPALSSPFSSLNITVLTWYTITHCSMLFPTVGWPTTSTLAVNLAYLYTLPLYTFFSSLYHNVVIQSTLLQHCDSLWYFQLCFVMIFIFLVYCLCFPNIIATWYNQ